MVYLPRIIRYKPLPEYYANLLAEFIGTFFLVITISMSLQQADTVGHLAPIGIGFMLCAFIFCFGYTSGAIYNPAVSVALFMIQLMDLKKAALYLVAQVSGGVCAAFVSWFLVGVNTKFKAPAPSSDDAGDIIRSMVAEFIFTFGLMTVIFNVACSRQRDNQHYGLAIALFVIAAAFSVGGISGGAFNPAVATGLQVVNCVARSCHNLGYLWLYWVAPIGGAMCAALTFGLMHPVDIEDDASPINLPGENTGASQAIVGGSGAAGFSGYSPRPSGQFSTRESVQSRGATRVSYGIQAPNKSQQIPGVPHRSPTSPAGFGQNGSFGLQGDATAVFVNGNRAPNNASGISDESLQPALEEDDGDHTQAFLKKE